MEIQESKSESGFLKVDRKMLHSNYWKYILDAHDRAVFIELCLSIPPKSKLYKKGLLVSYKKIDNIVKELGIAAGKTSVKKALAHLSKLGVIIKIKTGIKTNNAYIIGFNVVGQRLYFLDYLIKKYDNRIDSAVDEDTISMTNEQKQFIFNNIENNLPLIMVKKDTTLTEEMFDINPITGKKKIEYLHVVKKSDGFVSESM